MNAMADDEILDCEVAIVGYGPCGAAAAALLGAQGIRTWVCDKSFEVYDKPRAFALDHEIMRVFQQMGIHDQVLQHAEPFTPSEFYGVDGQLIKRFSTVEPPFPLGFDPSLVFNQPAMERVLRAHVATLPTVQLALGVEALDLAQDTTHATLRVRSHTGRAQTVRARYVIACDGASSSIRAMAGITLDDLGFDQPWLVVDVMATDAGAAKLPQVSIQYCEPARPSTYLVGPGNHRRWEISINEGEDPREVATPEGTWKLLARWLTPQDGTLWRQASYRFHALVASTWRAGPVFVAGDAAHQQPPFLGQGMCQGIRDVTNLAWKLHAVLRDNAPDALLDTYGEERKAHVQALTTRIKAIGQIIGERDLDAARARDARLLAECGGVVPSVPRQDVQPALECGLIAGSADSGAGRIFPQPWLEDAEGRRTRMDEVCGRGWRVVLNSASDAALRAVANAQNAAHVVALGAVGLRDSDGVAKDWFERHGCQAAIVRPDHCVYATAMNAQQLQSHLQALAPWRIGA
jgi:3-(3-hydroxy-phenyl)propionate hydroxylase